MSSPAKKLDLDDDEPFQRSEWRIQRVAWVIWGAIISAALLGFLGSGPFSRREATAPDGSLKVSYDHFVHYHHPTTLELMVSPGGQANSPVALKLSQPYLDRMQIQFIEPEPESRSLADAGIVYGFRRQTSDGIHKIVFHVEYERFGKTEAAIELEGHEPVTFTQFVYP